MRTQGRWLRRPMAFGLILIASGCELSSTTEGPVDGPGQGETTIKGTGAMDSATLSIPRYKIFQDPVQTQNIWVGLGVESGPDTYFSSDSGKTWMEIGSVGWEYHMSMAGNADQYVHFINRGSPAATYHRLRSTAFQTEAQTSFADYGEQATSGNIAVNGSEVVVFTRNRDDDSSPVHFHRSVDNGETWQDGIVSGTGNPSRLRHRIGSCVVDGEISLVYWKGGGAGSGDTVTFYRWNGEDFTPLDGVFTTQARSDWTRQYSVTQDASGFIHLVLWDQVDGRKVVLHSIRTLESDWSAPETVAAWENDDIHPQLSSYGEKVLLLYRFHPQSIRSEDARVYYRVWNRGSGWTEGIQLSGSESAGARFPVAPQRVSAASDYIPVMWTVDGGVKFVSLSVQ